MQKPCHNHEEISQPHSPARCTPARDSASSSAGLPGGMASWALPWLLAASEPFGPDAMTPAEGMSQVNKMVSLSLSHRHLQNGMPYTFIRLPARDATKDWFHICACPRKSFCQPQASGPMRTNYIQWESTCVCVKRLHLQNCGWLSRLSAFLFPWGCCCTQLALLAVPEYEISWTISMHEAKRPKCPSLCPSAPGCHRHRRAPPEFGWWAKFCIQSWTRFPLKGVLRVNGPLSPRGPLSKENVLLVEAFSMNMKAFNNLP